MIKEQLDASKLLRSKDSATEKFKTRMVAMGFTLEVFLWVLPIRCLNCLTIILLLKELPLSWLITLAPILKLIIHMIYVKTTFLQEDLHQEIIIGQPEWFVVPKKSPRFTDQ